MDVIRERGIYYGAIKFISPGGGIKEVIGPGSETSSGSPKVIQGPDEGEKVSIYVGDHREPPNGKGANVTFEIQVLFRPNRWGLGKPVIFGGHLREGASFQVTELNGARIYHEPSQENLLP